jgi:hypothetical protein
MNRVSMPQRFSRPGTPELRALKEKLEAEMKALENPKPSEKERTERINRMAPDLQALRSKGLAKSGIDVRAMNDEIRRALSNGVKPRGEAGGETEMLHEEDSAFYYSSSEEEELPPASEVTTRGTSTRTLTEPWPFAEVKTQINKNVSFVDKEAGKYQSSGYVGVAGYGTDRRGLAHFLTVPSGTTTIWATAQLPETYFFNYVLGAVFGGGQAQTLSHIDVWGRSSRRLCLRSRLHADVWGLIAAYFKERGFDNVVLDCEFDAPAAGRDIVVKFFSDVFAQAWGLGAARGDVRAEPANVRIELISPTTTIKRYYSR